jgi:two-component system, chemotaxis family, CheB/CheR fusion protein
MDDSDTTESPENSLGPPPKEKARDKDLMVVGIGASAGGLEAITELLRHLPPTTGMAFVFVQHLDPHHESALPELLAMRTRMAVIQVHGDTVMEPDHVYVIPPNTQMLVRDRVLTIEARPASAERFTPIDAFFESLAKEFRFSAVGVVLSGAATDGTLGLKIIKAEGGITFAQNQTAKFDSMPRSAITAGAVDFVLSPRRIAEELIAIGQRTLNLDRVEAEVLSDGATLHRLLMLLRHTTGVDFTQYKQPTIFRRLNRRMILRNAHGIDAYFEILKNEPEETKTLFDDLLINVTDFFRDPEVFQSVKEYAFPAIIREHRRPQALRAWIPGCSTGEEVYSMAIALVEFLESQDLDCPIQIFGTDVSETVIARARAGIYGESSVANVSSERLRRFFMRTDSGYQISPTIREMCIFSRHNVCTDPPLSRMDLVSCRNLLIYLSPSLQRRIIAAFGYALQPNGCLILGSSETLGSLSEHFTTLDEPRKIYCKKNDLAQSVFALSDIAGDYARDYPSYVAAAATDRSPISSQQQPFPKAAVPSQYGPAGVLVDESLRIVAWRGPVGDYLERAANGISVGLMDALHPELRASLSTAIEQSGRVDGAVVAKSIPDLPGGPPASSVTMTVVPASMTDIPHHFLVLFGRASEGRSAPPPMESGWNAAPGSPSATGIEENGHLKQELKATREYLQSVVEELRSANEEAQSANEELQSTNEELQTSKEEPQSTNEELNTINAEMQSRNADLGQINNDLLNLLGSMNMPIVMTSGDLRIRRFTPSAEKVLRLIPTDVGRPIADLKPRINVPNLEEIMRQVVDTLQPHEQEVQDQEGRLYLLRVRPYRTADNRIEGAVLQMFDVSELHRSLQEVKQARDYAEAIVNTVGQPLAVLDNTLAVQQANSAFFDVTPTAVLGQSIFEVGRGRFDAPAVHAMLERLVEGALESSGAEIEYKKEWGETRFLVLNARRLPGPGGKRFALVAFDDITESKRAAEARYRRLFESARDGILLINADSGEIVDLNPFTEQLLGYGRQELTGYKIWDSAPFSAIPQMRSAVEQIRDRGMLRFDDLTLRTKSGGELHTEVIANAYMEGDKRVIQFNIRDVTERMKFARELQETQKLEGLGLLAGGIAHDFNNLLTGVLGNASLALSELAPEQPARGRLREIMQAGERAAFLTRQMLAYAGRGHFVVERTDLNGLIQEMTTLVRTSIAKSVEVSLDLAPNLPVVEADVSQIQQVVMNLVINAAEAIGENAVGKVAIRTSTRDIRDAEAADLFRPHPGMAGTYVEMEVTDTGIGMDEATKARIFDPFFTTKFTGRGLGLAAVQGIIKAHGGVVRVYSTPGHGATFVILLPAKGERAAGPNAGIPGNASIPAGSAVLIVDDEDTVRKLARNVLTRAGMNVYLAENGASGVEVFRQHHGIFSIVLLDLMMPVMGGEEALLRMKDIDPTVPIILSSGFDESEAVRRFPQSKPARFLQKPYTAQSLLAAVAATLAASKAKPAV